MRLSKVHLIVDGATPLCGIDGRTAPTLSAVTCRVCMFRFLASRAPWAEQFMRSLTQKGREEGAQLAGEAAKAYIEQRLLLEEGRLDAARARKAIV